MADRNIERAGRRLGVSHNENNPVTAILLVAGVGRRLGQAKPGPKVLLEFGGRSLLARHIDALAACGVDELVLIVGFEADQVEMAIRRLDPPFKTSLLTNPRFAEGSAVSLAASGGILRSGRTVLLMDGDVLYDPRMLRRLIQGRSENTLLVDRELEPGDEPVKVCFDPSGAIVDFRKKPVNPGVRHGESVGFFRFSPATAADLAERADWYMANAPELEYEEAIRDLMLAEPLRFGAEDVTDLPWTEIDFVQDVIRAREVILPQLEVLA
jgi:choline kinase